MTHNRDHIVIRFFKAIAAKVKIALQYVGLM